MGENSNTPLKLEFDRRIRLEFRRDSITSDTVMGILISL